MNKIITAALAAGGLLVLPAPQAAAHNEMRVAHAPTPHYQMQLERPRHMPYWLKRDRAFRHWYRHTRLRRQRHLTWTRLFYIYRQEIIDRRKHRRDERFADNHHYFGHQDRGVRRRQRH